MLYRVVDPRRGLLLYLTSWRYAAIRGAHEAANRLMHDVLVECPNEEDIIVYPAQ